MTEFFCARQVCPVCGQENAEELFRSRFIEPPVSEYLRRFYAPQGCIELELLDKADYVLEHCWTCDLVYQRNAPSNALLTQLYEKWIDPHKAFELYERKRGVHYYFALAEEIRFVINYFRQPPGELKLLDYGMGWGQWCRMAGAFGTHVSGCEISQARLDHARALGIRTISHEEIADEQFDFINAEQVFEHLVAPFEILTYLANALAPGGVIRISVPNGSDIMRRLTLMDWSAPKEAPNSLNPVSPLEHLNCFNSRSLSLLGERAGLRPVLVDRTLHFKTMIRAQPLHRLPYALFQFGRPFSTSIVALFEREKH